MKTIDLKIDDLRIAKEFCMSQILRHDIAKNERAFYEDKFKDFDCMIKKIKGE